MVYDRIENEINGFWNTLNVPIIIIPLLCTLLYEFSQLLTNGFGELNQFVYKFDRNWDCLPLLSIVISQIEIFIVQAQHTQL